MGQFGPTIDDDAVGSELDEGGDLPAQELEDYEDDIGDEVLGYGVKDDFPEDADDDDVGGIVEYGEQEMAEGAEKPKFVPKRSTTAKPAPKEQAADPVEGDIPDEDLTPGQRNALAAKARIASRDREIAEKRMQQLLTLYQNQQEQMAALLQQRQQVDGEPSIVDDDDDITPFETSPAHHIAGRLERLERTSEAEREARRKELEQQEAARNRAVHEQAFVGAIQSANADAVAFRGSLENPAEYDDAVAFLTSSMANEMMELHPNASSHEVQVAVTQLLTDRALNWKASGRNVGESVLNLARARGHRFAPVPAKQPAAPRGDDPREVVRRQRDRAAASRSIAGVPGSGGAPPVTAKTAIRMSEDKWEEYLDSSNKDFRDVLADKAAY